MYIPALLPWLPCLCRCLTLQNSGFPDSNRCAPTRSNQLSREAGRNLLKSESWNRYGKNNFDSDNFDFENHAQIQNQHIYIYLPSLSLFPMSFLGFPITYNVTGTGCNQALILGRWAGFHMNKTPKQEQGPAFWIQQGVIIFGSAALTPSEVCLTPFSLFFSRRLSFSLSFFSLFLNFSLFSLFFSPFPSFSLLFSLSLLPFPLFFSLFLYFFSPKSILSQRWSWVRRSRLGIY